MKEYFCIKDYIMTDGRIAYKAGETYSVKGKLEDGWFIFPSLFDETHKMNTDDDFFEHFIDVKKEQKKILKRLQRYQENGIKASTLLDEFVGGITVNGYEVVKPKDSIVESVIERFRDRSEVGIKKYNTTLDRNDLSVLEWLQHLQEEIMDACLYIEKLKKETNERTQNKTNAEDKDSNEVSYGSWGKQGIC